MTWYYAGHVPLTFETSKNLASTALPTADGINSSVRADKQNLDEPADYSACYGKRCYGQFETFRGQRDKYGPINFHLLFLSSVIPMWAQAKGQPQLLGAGAPERTTNTVFHHFSRGTRC